MKKDNTVRPIDANQLMRLKRRVTEYDEAGFSAEIRAVPADEIEATPTLDYAPVVRCKDCIHYYDGACLKIYSDGNVSADAWQVRKPQDFCSYGETEEQMKKGEIDRETD